MARSKINKFSSSKDRTQQKADEEVVTEYPFTGVLQCPSCKESYGHRQLEGEQGHLPHILTCAHKICHSCLLHQISTDLQSGFLCPVCEHLQPSCASNSIPDIVKLFPLEFTIIGMLSALETFPRECVVKSYKVLEKMPVLLESDFVLCVNKFGKAC